MSDETNPATEEEIQQVEVVPGEAPQPALRKPTSLLPEERTRLLVAILFATPEALSPAKLGEIVGGMGAKAMRQWVDETREWILSNQLPFRLEEVGGGYRLLSHSDYEPYLKKLSKVRKRDRLSQAALETLSIVAYRQPIIKAEIEAIRGVKVDPILRNLVEKRLVKVAGRAKVPGRPLQYGTTATFLDRFGLKSLDDLPTLEELRQAAAE